jgi:AAA domain
MHTVATGGPACQSALVDSILPSSSVHLLAGAPGAGKTTLAAWLLRQVHDGAPIFDHQSHPPSAMAVIVADRPWASHAQWFRGVGLEDIQHYSFQDDSGFRWDQLRRTKAWMPSLLRAIDHQDLPPHSFLLIDPISLFLGGDLLDYISVFCALGELFQFCVDRQLTILGTAHSGKLRVGKEFQYVRPQDRILGSTALVGCADTVMYLATPSELRERYWELYWAPHHAEPGSTRLLRDPGTGLFRLAPFALSRAERARAREAATAKAVRRHAQSLKLLASLFPETASNPDDGTSTAVLLERGVGVGLSRRTVYRHVGQLVRMGLIVQVSRGYWKRGRAH